MSREYTTRFQTFLNIHLLGNWDKFCQKSCIVCVIQYKYIFFLQYLSKTARISVENIERLSIFYKFILGPYRIMQIRSELISIAKLDTIASLYVRKTLYFLVSLQNIELETSKHEFTDISHQNKQGFEDKKLSGTDFTAFQQNVCQSMAYSAKLNQRSLLFYNLYFRVYFACYPPESFKIICLTCIWLKFVDTSFHSSQN